MPSLWHVSSVDIDSLDAAVAQDSSLFDVSHISDDLLIEESGKVVFLIGLMDNWSGAASRHHCPNQWYGIVGFNVPLDTL